MALTQHNLAIHNAGTLVQGRLCFIFLLMLLIPSDSIDGYPPSVPQQNEAGDEDHTGRTSKVRSS